MIVFPGIRTLAMTLALVIGVVFAGDAHAEGVSLGDLQAVVRALGFLDTIPHDGVVVVGIAYRGDTERGRASAEEAAERLQGLTGRDATVFHPALVDADHLERAPERLDALFLMPGISDRAEAIAAFMHQRHLVTVSSDPACLDARCCVLLVRTDQRIEIVLDTGLADAVDAHFSPIFTMMVKRK